MEEMTRSRIIPNDPNMLILVGSKSHPSTSMTFCPFSSRPAQILFLAVPSSSCDNCSGMEAIGTWDVGNSK